MERILILFRRISHPTFPQVHTTFNNPFKTQTNAAISKSLPVTKPPKMKEEAPKQNTKMSPPHKPETPIPTSKPFTNLTDTVIAAAAFTYHYYVYSTTVHLIHPPQSDPTSRPWITARETTKDGPYIFRHPLTSKPYSVTLPRNLHFSQLEPSTLTNLYSFGTSGYVDKLLPLKSPSCGSICVPDYTMFVLYGGGEMEGIARYVRVLDWVKTVKTTWPWINLTHHRGEKFDDVVEFEGKVYVVDRQGLVKLINHYKTVRKINIGKTVVFESVTPGSGRFGWRKRFVVDAGNLYLVVRMEEKKFEIFTMRSRGKTSFYWDRVPGFGGDKVLFMAREWYFFLRASRKFPGREYRNCIVFSEAAFPQYGMDGWEFTEIDNVQRCEDDIAVFRLGDGRFVREREGEHSGFPKIDWSPPDWVLNVSSFSAVDFKKHSVSESSSGSEREPDEEEGSDSDSGDTSGEEVQSRLKDIKSKDEEEQEAMESDLKDTESKDEEEQEEMESDFGRLDQDQDGVECDSNSQDQEDVTKMQCDSKSREKDDVEMPVNANTEGGASLQEDVCHVSPSLFRPRSGNTVSRSFFSPAEEENIRKTVRELVLKAFASSTKASTKAALNTLESKSGKSDSATAKFEGFDFDIRPDSVSTLEKIWQKHGNIIENCAVRNNEIIARALESLVTIIRILDDNSPLSLSDSQADYLVSTLSDLRYIHFKVDWLIPFVEKAERIHKSKASLESLNTLSQLSSKAEERRAILLEELTKLDVEEKTRKEEMAKISKTIHFCGLVKFDKPLGSGLT